MNLLGQALVRLDIGTANSAIEAIRAHHPSLADSLGAVAEDLQFAQMMDVIRATAGKNDLVDKRCSKR